MECDYVKIVSSETHIFGLLASEIGELNNIFDLGNRKACDSL